MTENRYPEEVLDQNDEDDGTIVKNVQLLREQVVGHRIVKIEEKAKPIQPEHSWNRDVGLLLTLDDGRIVQLIDTDDCCAYTATEEVIRHLDQIDHVITGVGTTEGYTKWHIYADLGDVLEVQVGWSCGNPFYYAYGFDIVVVEPDGTMKKFDRYA